MQLSDYAFHRTTMHYFALIGDIDASREIEDRAEVQRTIQQTIGMLNNGELSTKQEAPLRLVSGDEVQGLTREPEYLLDVIVALSDAVAPVQLSWGAGCGSLSTDLATDIAVLDGSSFHRARDALASAKKRDRWFDIHGVAETDNEVLTALMNLMGAIRSGWTERQSEYVRAARGRMQTEVAEMKGVYPSTVSRALQATSFGYIKEGEAAARTVFAALTPAEDG